MKIESFPRKLFLFRNNLCMFAQTQNELHKHEAHVYIGGLFAGTRGLHA